MTDQDRGDMMKLCTHEELIEYSRDQAFGSLHQAAHALRRELDRRTEQLEQMTQKAQMAMDQREAGRKEVARVNGTAPRDRLSVFGEKVWDSIKTRAADGSLNEEEQDYLDWAVEIGLCRLELYDLDKHDADLQEFLVPGEDHVYWWGDHEKADVPPTA